ncbi:MAG TPA: hypothetical protein VEQ34_08535, partial [Pyrinomonadaceae bacterium]|nr:hypothetical protein [Pyrinomonadaceae bacterium]
FAVGSPFDACVVKADEPLLANVRPENLASTIVYSTDASQIYGTFVSGKLIQTDAKQQSIKKDFIDCVESFRS